MDLTWTAAMLLYNSEGEGRGQTAAAHHRPEPAGRAHPPDPGEEAERRVAQTLHLGGGAQHRVPHHRYDCHMTDSSFSLLLLYVWREDHLTAGLWFPPPR